MQYKDYYKIMGLERGATPDDIKKAYRKLARQYHPDVSKAKDAEEKFKDVNEAYEVLKDPEKRSKYDQLGAGWSGDSDFTPPPGWQGGFSGGGYTHVDAGDFSDFFSQIFGGGGGFGGRAGGGRHRPHYAPQAGEPINAKLAISLEDAYRGMSKEMTLQFPPSHPGQAPITKTLNVKIPPGILAGQQIRLKGQGQEGAFGGPAGDLYLTIEFLPNEMFSVDKADIYLNVPLAPWEAALGTNLQAPTLAGFVDVKIPPGSQTGQKLRLKGRGLPAKQPGDQYLVLQIMTPPAINSEQQELYKQMAEKFQFNPRKERGWA